MAPTPSPFSKLPPSRVSYRPPKRRSPASIYPHVSVVFPNAKELQKFDDAISEEKRINPGLGLTRSNIIVRLVKRWVKCEVSI